MPLIGCRFEDSRADALGTERGSLEIVLCDACGHIYNRAFEADRIEYAPGYENALDFSARHRAFLDGTVEHLTRTYDLHGKSIVEIGCGAAELLSRLCARGGNHGIGYDPTQPGRTSPAGEGSVTIVPATFRLDSAQSADMVCSQHVLEHLDDPGVMLRQARAALKPGGIAYFQVPNGLTIFRDLGIWDLTYEHVSYFSPASLQRALSAAGFKVVRVRSSFGEQYLDVEAVVDDAAAATGPLVGYSDSCAGFPAAFDNIVRSWKDRIAGLIGPGSRIVLWGAGTKAVSFLNILAIGADDGIEYVVDVNPRKAGRYLPGTGQRVVSPGFLRDYPPDVVVIMNREYVAEIRSLLESMRIRCELMSASPAAM